MKKKKKKKKEEFINNAIAFIEKESKGINNDLLKKNFDLGPVALAKKLFEIKDARENSRSVEEIKNRLSNLKDKIEKMSKKEIKNEKPNEILEIISEIIDFNKELQKQRNQKGHGLKMLTPNQMLSRLSISLAQLNAGNNSEKLKNEIRQLLYSLYRSRKLTTNIYKSLINII